MLHDPKRLIAIVLAVGVFLLVFGVWQAVLLVWSSRRLARMRKVQERLRMTMDSNADQGLRTLRLWHDGQEATTHVSGLTGWDALSARLEQFCRSAGWNLSPSSFLTALVFGTLFIFVLVLIMTQRVAVSAAAAAGALLIFHTYAQRRMLNRAELFERQLLDALHVAVSSLRAGHPISGAFRFISLEVGAPVGPLFGRMCQRHELGASLEAVIREAAEESQSADLKLFATSVTVQMRSGGNLADMMDRLAAVIRDRMNVSRRMRVLTTQAQFSKRVLAALPIAFFGLLNLVNPAYMQPLFMTTQGKVLLVISAAMMLIGIWVMNRLVVSNY